MKVVLFCGGYGMRMRDGVSDLPKPMHQVGPRPLIWHVMRYYAHFGHKDFVLCLGYGAHHIKDFFLNYDETASNDFVLRGTDVELLGSDIKDWTITFAHTGLDSPIGERLRRVRKHVEGEEMFLANYADVLTDAPLDRMIDRFRASTAVGGLLAVPPQSAFHCVDIGEGDGIASITMLQEMPLWENGGYLMFRPEVFDHIEEGCDLIGDVCAPLAKRGQMMAYRHRGFWQPADTVKERTALEAAYQGGTRPWMLWDSPDRDPLQAAIAELQDRLDR
jgi:glucose-1-phosphate cytidylyltransferase